MGCVDSHLCVVRGTGSDVAKERLAGQFSWVPGFQCGWEGHSQLHWLCVSKSCIGAFAVSPETSSSFSYPIAGKGA